MKNYEVITKKKNLSKGLVEDEYFIHRHNKNAYLCKVNKFSISHLS